MTHKTTYPAAETRDRSAGLQRSDDADLTPAMLLDIYRLLRLASVLRRQMPPLLGVPRERPDMSPASIGAVSAIHPGDVILPNADNLGAHLAAGLELQRILAQHFGRDSGYSKGRDGGISVADRERGVLPSMPFPGVNIPLAAGAALALRSSGSIALTLLPESALTCGDVHEGLNFAAVLSLPLVVVVEGCRMLSRHAEDPSLFVRNRAAAYGVTSEVIDGADALAAYFATAEAAARARSGCGPTVIHAIPFVAQPNVTSAHGAQSDGLTRLAGFLRDEGIMSEEQQADLDRILEREVAMAADWAEAEPMPADGGTPAVYA